MRRRRSLGGPRFGASGRRPAPSAPTKGALAITAKALAGHGDRDPGLTGADPLVLGLALLVLGAFAIVYAWSRMRAAEPTPSRPVAPTPRPEPADAAGGI